MKHGNKYDNYRECSVSINNQDLRLYHHCDTDLYTFSVRINRDEIIKLIRVLNE